jgi:hypothetical protein
MSIFIRTSSLTGGAWASPGSFYLLTERVFGEGLFVH